MKKYYKFEFNNIILQLLCNIPSIILIILLNNTLKPLTNYIENSLFWVLLLGGILLWYCLHEIIHGIAYRLTGTKKENITFGMAIEKGVFYCLSNQEIPKNAVLISLLAPLVIIGIITLIISIIFKLPLLCLLSIINIGGATGDIMMFFYIMGLDNELQYKELGEATSFILITKEDLTKRQHFGVKLLESGEYKKEQFENKNLKKINISKTSYIVLIVYIVIITLLLIL